MRGKKEWGRDEGEREGNGEGMKGREREGNGEGRGGEQDEKRE